MRQPANSGDSEGAAVHVLQALNIFLGIQREMQPLALRPDNAQIRAISCRAEDETGLNVGDIDSAGEQRLHID